MLQLRPNCECCDTDLPPDADARICSFECTFCPACTSQLFHACPNCGGELVKRPVRLKVKLAANPASTKRIYRAEPCFSDTQA